VVGATIDAVKKKIRKNTANNGEFGRSNRTWILSQAFAGSDITTEYIAGEASLVPKPERTDGHSPFISLMTD